METLAFELQNLGCWRGKSSFHRNFLAQPVFLLLMGRFVTSATASSTASIMRQSCGRRLVPASQQSLSAVFRFGTCTKVRKLRRLTEVEQQLWRASIASNSATRNACHVS